MYLLEQKLYPVNINQALKSRLPKYTLIDLQRQFVPFFWMIIKGFVFPIFQGSLRCSGSNYDRYCQLTNVIELSSKVKTWCISWIFFFLSIVKLTIGNNYFHLIIGKYEMEKIPWMYWITNCAIQNSISISNL